MSHANFTNSTKLRAVSYAAGFAANKDVWKLVTFPHVYAVNRHVCMHVFMSAVERAYVCICVGRFKNNIYLFKYSSPYTSRQVCC